MQDSAAVNHRIQRLTRRGEAPDRRPRRGLEEAEKGGKSAVVVSWIGGIGKADQPPAGIGLDQMAEMHRFAIGKPDRRCRMKAHAKFESGGQMLMAAVTCQRGRFIAHGHAGGVAAMLDEILLEFRGVAVIAAAVAFADDAGPFLIEGDQVPGDLLAFFGIATQKRDVALSAKDRGKFPAKVEAVTHRHIHTLAGLRTVGMAGVAGDEYPWVAGGCLVACQVVEPVGQPLPDFINGPPDNILHIEFIGFEDALRRPDQVRLGDVAVAHPLAFAKRFHLDIDSRHITAFARDDQKRAAMIGLDQRLLPDVGEIGHGQHIHDAPGLVGGIALQLKSDGCAHIASRAVASDHIARPDGLGLALMARIIAPDGGGDGVRGVFVDLKADKLAAIVGNQPGRAVGHHFEIHVMDPRLVQDHMRHFRKPVLDILDAAGADDVLRGVRIGFPEGGFIHLIGLVPDLVGEPEGGEHLHRPAGHAVCLAALHRAGLALDDHRADVVEGRHLGRQRQTGGPAADNQHIGCRGKGASRRAAGPVRADFGIAGLEPVQMKLHMPTFLLPDLMIESCQPLRNAGGPACAT